MIVKSNENTRRQVLASLAVFGTLAWTRSALGRRRHGLRRAPNGFLIRTTRQ